MAAEADHALLVDAVLQEVVEEARRLGWQEGPELLILVAQMLALGASTAKQLEGPRSSFLDIEETMTSALWKRTVGQMAGVLAALHSNQPVPFPPGLVEKVRRQLLRLSFVREGKPLPASLIQRFLALAEGRHGHWPVLSPDLQLLVCEALAVRPGETVFCADVGAIGVALHLAAERDAEVHLETSDVKAGVLAAWLAAAAGVRMHVLKGGDTPVLIHQAAGMKREPFAESPFDVAVLNLPWGMRSGEQTAGGLSGRVQQYAATSPEAGHVVEAARRGLRAACIIPTNYLFRPTHAEQMAKQEAITRYGLDTVVALPRSAMGRHANVASALVLLASTSDTDRRHVLMVDPRSEAEHGRKWHEMAAQAIKQRTAGEIAALVPIADLEAQDMNLSPDRYVLGEEARHARSLLSTAQTRLDDLAELYRPQAHSASLAVRGRRTEQVEDLLDATGSDRLLEVTITDIDEAGLVREPSKSVVPTPEVIQRSRRSRLEPGDILIVNKGSIGKIGFVRAIPDGETWIASQSFVIARLRRGGQVSDPLVLFRFLSSDVGQAALRSLGVGTTIPGLQINDIRRLPVLVPKPSEQKSIAAAMRSVFGTHDRIQEIRAEAKARLLELWPHG